jgi:hypothetical protein
MSKASQFLIYQSEDGRTKLDVRLDDQTVWLSQKQLTALFGKAKGTISEHIKHIFEDGELVREATVRLFRTTAPGYKISAEAAKSHAEQEFTEFRREENRLPESDFDRAVKQLPPPRQSS